MKADAPGRPVLVVLLVLSLVGCATYRPVLYPNARVEEVGQEGANRDIAECERMAKAAGASPGTGKAGEVATGADDEAPAGEGDPAGGGAGDAGGSGGAGGT